MNRPPRALVITVVHHPADARIRHRQISALLDAGWEVTYAAPWEGHGAPRQTEVPGLRTVEVVRAAGRRRLAALRSARGVLRRLGQQHDVVLLHDPELLPATLGLGSLPPVVWDVHEDTSAAVEVRSWLPRLLRRPAAMGVHWWERWAEDRFTLILADEQYAGRFRRPHPVVPNTTRVPADPPPAGSRPGDVHRVVYLGSVTLERGAQEMVEVAGLLRSRTGGGVRLEVLGPAHGVAGELLRRAHDQGELQWVGFVPNDEALARLDGALAGLSLLHDVANFRPSMPTKVVEYLAHAVPAITTPLPVAADLVGRSGGGVVVPFRDVDAVVAQVVRWHEHPAEAAAAGRAGHATVAADHDWAAQAPRFVELLRRAADAGLSSSVADPGRRSTGSAPAASSRRRRRRARGAGPG